MCTQFTCFTSIVVCWMCSAFRRNICVCTQFTCFTSSTNTHMCVPGCAALSGETYVYVLSFFALLVVQTHTYVCTWMCSAFRRNIRANTNTCLSLLALLALLVNMYVQCFQAKHPRKHKHLRGFLVR
jgi:hypothetical protein